MRAADRELVRELVRREVNAAVADVRRSQDDELAELRDELYQAVADIDRRITLVHEQAIRELTRRAEGTRTA